MPDHVIDIAAQKRARHDEDARKDATRLFRSLEERTGDLQKYAVDFGKRATEISVSDYMVFRNLMSECLTFLIIVEKRLNKVEEPTKSELEGQLQDLTIAIWSIILNGALEFLQGISAQELLPLGSRDIFIRELRTLYEADKVFTAPDYQAKISKDIQKKLKTAERILDKIIERAPGLLQLT